MTTDGTSLYVTDNHMIRKIVIASGVVTTIAGTADEDGDTNGLGAVARFKDPRGITSDGAKLYIADEGNSIIRVIEKK